MATFFVDSASLNNTQVSNSLLVTSDIYVTGSMFTTGVTGSILGTSSFSLISLSSSYVSSSNIYGAVPSASYALTSSFSSITSSYNTIAGANMALAAAYLSGSNRTLFSNQEVAMQNSSVTLVSGSIYLSAIYVPSPTIITGIRTRVANSNIFTTSSNYNGMMLYSYNGAGTLNLVASSSNNPNIWIGPASIKTGSFASPILLSPGAYYIGCLYNRTTETTAPALNSSTVAYNSNLVTMDFTNSAALYYNTSVLYSSSIPTSIATSTLSVITSRMYVSLY